MRICLISGEFPPMQGGVGDFTRELARELVVQGHETHVLTTSGRPAANESSEPYYVHRAVRHWGWRCWRNVGRWIAAHQPDAVDLQYQAAAYAMRPAIHLLPWRLRRLPHQPAIAITYHDLKVPYLFPKAGPLRWQAVLALARWADAAIVTNEQDRLTLRRYPWLTDRLAFIPIGSNIAAQPPPGYDRDAWRARYGLDDDDLLLAYFGFLNPTKGGETLIRTLHHLSLRPPAGRTAHLLMIGGQVGSSDPTNRAYLQHVKALVDQLGLQERIHRTGYVPTEEVSANLLAADVCVLPYEDGASFRRGSFMAALTHRRPIVTTHPRVPLSQLREGENVLLAPPGDAVSIAAAVARLAADPSLCQRLGQGAATLAKQFTWQRIAARTAGLFERLKTKNRG